ncbi:MAG: LysR substrate-binding domain-containing protein, partial [Acutalibacteraceae bacterium]
ETIHKKQNSLNIAFENPMTVEAVSRQLELFSKNNPECQLNIFCAQKPEILKQLESNKLDFAFLNNSDTEPDEKYCCIRFLLKQNEVICSRNYLSVKPLNSCVQVPTEVIWKKNEDKANINSFASIIKSLGEKEE